jgi:hypothetical protein
MVKWKRIEKGVAARQKVYSGDNSLVAKALSKA